MGSVVLSVFYAVPIRPMQNHTGAVSMPKLRQIFQATLEAVENHVDLNDAVGIDTCREIES